MNNGTLFGTDGIRNRFGETVLTIENIIHIGCAIARWIKEKSDTNHPTIYIARDTRISGCLLQSALQTSLLHAGISIIDVGVIPISALCYVLKKNILQCSPSPLHALMLSASHNPFYDNGIKILSLDGKITDHDEQQINAFFEQECIKSSLKNTNSQNRFGTIRYQHTEVFEQYTTAITSIFAKQFLHGKKIILDCAHGATYQIAPAIFRACGAQVIEINADPNGVNINEKCGATSLESLKNAVVEHHADIGFAFDGDGDRVIVVNNKGEIKDGDHILALLSTHTQYRTSSTIVGTIMSNQALGNYLEKKNITFVRVGVGDKNIAQYLTKNNLLLGGEPAGHIILHDHFLQSDGIMVALKIMETIIQTGNWNIDTFTPFAQFNQAIAITHKKQLTDSPLADIITKHEHLLNHGRMIVRYSGTEPVLRIMVEEENSENAYAIGMSLTNALKKKLES